MEIEARFGPTLILSTLKLSFGPHAERVVRRLVQAEYLTMRVDLSLNEFSAARATNAAGS